MFNTGSATPGNTSLFGQSTPANQNRTGSSFLFGNTTTQPSTLTSTPFSSLNAFGGTTPGTTTLQASSTSTGTTHRFDPVVGAEKTVKNGIQTQVRTKLMNLCGMTVYEKKSTEELRLEDYIDNRKFQSTTAAPCATPMFGGLATTATANRPTTSNMFGMNTTTVTPTLSGSLFGGQPAVSSAPTSSFAFGGSTSTAAPLTFGSAAPATATANTLNPFGATAPATSTFAFPFSSSQSPATTAAPPTFGFGGTSSLFPAMSTAASTTSFGFPASKPTTAGTFSFTPTSAVAATAPTLNMFSAAPVVTTTAPSLFTAMNQPAPTSTIFNTQSSVDTRTHLQLFQTMLNIQPFNSELDFLARNIKPNIGLDRNRLRTAPDPTSVHSVNNVFSPLLTKPSILTSSTTPPSTLANHHALPTHSHTLPSILLPSSTATTTTSLGLFGKRKLADSFLDDDDDNSLMMDDGPSLSMTKLSKAHTSKRPRVLDMNKIRSVVLGGGGGLIHEISRKDEENPSETFIVKSSSDHLSGWKKFATYDAYRASKTPAAIEILAQIDHNGRQVNVPEKQFQPHRAHNLPRLTHDDYYTSPRIDELHQYFNKQGQCIVKEFTVGREHYGSVTFQGSRINLAGLDLDRLIEIGRRQVTVYPDDQDKPSEGDELNCQAVISLLGVYPSDRSSSNSGEEVTDPRRLIEMNYGNYLREMTTKFQGEFISYDVDKGTWTFRVAHF